MYLSWSCRCKCSRAVWRGKSRAESQLKLFTKKLKIPSLSPADNPLHWENSTCLSADKDQLQGGEKKKFCCEVRFIIRSLSPCFIFAVIYPLFVEIGFCLLVCWCVLCPRTGTGTGTVAWSPGVGSVNATRVVINDLMSYSSVPVSVFFLNIF